MLQGRKEWGIRQPVIKLFRKKRSIIRDFIKALDFSKMVKLVREQRF